MRGLSEVGMFPLLLALGKVLLTHWKTGFSKPQDRARSFFRSSLRFGQIEFQFLKQIGQDIFIFFLLCSPIFSRFCLRVVGKVPALNTLNFNGLSVDFGGLEAGNQSPVLCIPNFLCDSGSWKRGGSGAFFCFVFRGWKSSRVPCLGCRAGAGAVPGNGIAARASMGDRAG